MRQRLSLLSIAILTILSVTIYALPAKAAAPQPGSFFASASIEENASYRVWSDGDLWPSCWADDDNLYAANGDGRGFAMFSLFYWDIAVNRIQGTLPNLSGSVTATGDEVGQIWTPGGHYNRKPTGMLCVNNTIYLAIQDLNLDFNDAPRASISESTDHGHTWTWDKSAPMFNDYMFTTLMFLDYGKNNANAIDNFIYVYGFDRNWRNRPDLFLARVPQTSILNRSTWQFYAGVDDQNQPAWSSNIQAKVPILRENPQGNGGTSAVSIMSQGGVVYNKPLNRYIYSSWTQFTFEFYESPTPWGPWSHFLSKSYGRYPWTAAKYGGYGTTIPSKFISPDGKEMWVQSNVCPCGNAGIVNYEFSLRKLVVDPSNV